MKGNRLTLIAEGRTAEIYAWDSGQILKLYRDWCPPDWAEYEARVARAVHAAGVPAPAVRERVEVNGRNGLIYERVDGVSMLQDMNARPWTLWKHARSLAKIQAHIHRHAIPDLPSYKDRLQYDIRNSQSLTEALQEKVLALLEALPEGKRLCHGDYHPGNIILTANGPVVIDWMTACSGSPWADVARSSMILKVGAKAAGKQVNPIILAFIHQFHRFYMNHYRAINPDREHEIKRWMPVIAAARLSENIIPEREALIKMMEEGLSD